jgi:serine/threonine-protein kinase
MWPTVLPGGKALLFTSVTGSRRDATHIEALSLATGARRVVVEPGTFPLYAPSGHLVFAREGALLAAPFDLDRLEVTGPAGRVIEDLAVDLTGASGGVALSGTGSLVYVPGESPERRLVWVSRQGIERSANDARGPYEGPRLAPDGRRMVVCAKGDLWVFDLVRPTFSPLTTRETAGNTNPVWTADGRRVVFRTLTGLRWMATDGSRESQAIPETSQADFPTAVSPDGEILAFGRFGADSSQDVYVLSLRGAPNPRLVVKTAGNDGGAVFSPDGRWMTYVSNESGQAQVYLRPFSGPDRKWQVSIGGGTQARWNPNGREIYYREGNRMMAVDVTLGPDPSLSPPRLLFEQPYIFTTMTIPNYDISPDGQRFLMVKDEQGAARLNMVLNWTEELLRRVPRAGR